MAWVTPETNGEPPSGLDAHGGIQGFAKLVAEWHPGVSATIYREVLIDYSILLDDGQLLTISAASN